MPRIEVRAAGPDDLDSALEVWLAAQHARRRTPTPARRDRVRATLAAAGVPGSLSLLATYGDRPAGMALTEDFADAAGPRPGTGHVAMVFVDPRYWGCRIGSALVERIQDEPRWSALSVWTRADNRRAQRLYASRGFADTGERSALQDGDEILRFTWPAG